MKRSWNTCDDTPSKQIHIDEEYLLDKTMAYLRAGGLRQFDAPDDMLGVHDVETMELDSRCVLCIRPSRSPLHTCSSCGELVCEDGHMLGSCAMCCQTVCSCCGRLDFGSRDVLVLCSACLSLE